MTLRSLDWANCFARRGDDVDSEDIEQLNTYEAFAGRADIDLKVRKEVRPVSD